MNRNQGPGPSAERRAPGSETPSYPRAYAPVEDM